jgi:tRNA (uracil-5-)-methyltransferase TRM9
VSPVHGRILIYVWAIEQDDLSKREIPHDPVLGGAGQDVFVPWVLSERKVKGKIGSGDLAAQSTDRSTVYHRYYHMFADGELMSLVRSAADKMGLEILPPPEESSGTRLGVEIFQEGWERSNYYVELRRWKR